MPSGSGHSAGDAKSYKGLRSLRVRGVKKALLSFAKLNPCKLSKKYEFSTLKVPGN